MPEITGLGNTGITPSTNKISSDGVKNDVTKGGIIGTQTTVADPNRVVRTTDADVNTGEQAYRYRNDSNFESFFRALRDTPALMDIYSDVFMTKLLNPTAVAFYGTEFAESVYKFMSEIDMTPEQLLNLMKEQNLMTNKFTGPFFDIVRNMVSNGNSRELTVAVLDFLKRYDAVTSNVHTENVMLSNIKSIASNILQSRSNQLVELMQEYPYEGGHTEKLAFMKNQVMPFLTKYVSQTHDYGVVRDMTALFSVSLSKFETGSPEAFKASFKNLAGYMQLTGMLDGINTEILQDKLMSGFNSPEQEDTQSTRMLDAFVDILSEGLGGKAGASNKAAFSDMISSLLMNESVYMPLTHLVIPANIDGKMMFSEMWIDSDDEGNAGERGEEANRSKIFVKFMIKELGNFDLLMTEKDGKVSMEIHYPEMLNDKTQKIRRDIPDIVRNNNLKIENLVLSKGRMEKNLTEIFPKIFSQKTSVDVSV